MHCVGNGPSICQSCNGAGKTKHKRRYIMKHGSVIEFGEFLVFCYDCNGTGLIGSDDSAPRGRRIER